MYQIIYVPDYLWIRVPIHTNVFYINFFPEQVIQINIHTEMRKINGNERVDDKAHIKAGGHS